MFYNLNLWFSEKTGAHLGLDLISAQFSCLCLMSSRVLDLHTSCDINRLTETSRERWLQDTASQVWVLAIRSYWHTTTPIYCPCSADAVRPGQHRLAHGPKDYLNYLDFSRKSEPTPGMLVLQVCEGRQWVPDRQRKR